MVAGAYFEAADGVGVDASLIGDREEVAAQGHAELVSIGSPVRGILILQVERQRGGTYRGSVYLFFPFPKMSAWVPVR